MTLKVHAVDDNLNPRLGTDHVVVSLVRPLKSEASKSFLGIGLPRATCVDVDSCGPTHCTPSLGGQCTPEKCQSCTLDKKGSWEYQPDVPLNIHHTGQTWLTDDLKGDLAVYKASSLEQLLMT